MKQDQSKPQKDEAVDGKDSEKIESKTDAIDLIVDKKQQGVDANEGGNKSDDSGDQERKLIEELCNNQTRCIICLEDWPITATLGKNIEVQVEIEEEEKVSAEKENS